VALGLLVDDSIVVVENIERWLRDGYSRREAVLRGTKQITLAVLGTTATLVIAFLPLVFLPGGPGEFVRGLPLAVIATVMGSLFVSLTIVPFGASFLLKPHAHPEGNWLLQALQRGIRATYSRLVGKALHWPKTTLLVSMALFVAALGLFPAIGFKLFPASEKPIFLVNVRMPQQTSLLHGNRIARMLEDSLRRDSRIQYFTYQRGQRKSADLLQRGAAKRKGRFRPVFRATPRRHQTNR
jgi:multidrug efflux pump subunit AcrB